MYTQITKGRFHKNLPSGIIRIPFESSSSIQLPAVRTHQAGGTSLETACQAMSWQLGIVLKKHVFFEADNMKGSQTIAEYMYQKTNKHGMIKVRLEVWITGWVVMRISEFRWVQRPNAVEPRFLRHVFGIICDTL